MPACMQVQGQLDASLRADHLGRVCFFGQHMGGGLLDKTDAAIKSEPRSMADTQGCGLQPHI